jgi:hypothetical protein
LPVSGGQIDKFSENLLTEGTTIEGGLLVYPGDEGVAKETLPEVQREFKYPPGLPVRHPVQSTMVAHHLGMGFEGLNRTAMQEQVC